MKIHPSLQRWIVKILKYFWMMIIEENINDHKI